MCERVWRENLSSKLCVSIKKKKKNTEKKSEMFSIEMHSKEGERRQAKIGHVKNIPSWQPFYAPLKFQYGIVNSFIKQCGSYRHFLSQKKRKISSIESIDEVLSQFHLLSVRLHLLSHKLIKQFRFSHHIFEFSAR